MPFFCFVSVAGVKKKIFGFWVNSSNFNNVLLKNPIFLSLDSVIRTRAGHFRYQVNVVVKANYRSIFQFACKPTLASNSLFFYYYLTKNCI